MKISSIYNYWTLLNGTSIGRWLFNRLVAVFNPYTGALGAKVITLEPGYCQIQLAERRGVRNHLNSIHAIALSNLGEFASGLALISQLPDAARGIPIEIKSHYFKKARGLLTADSRVNLPVIDSDLEHWVTTDIQDEQQQSVARVEVCWKLGLKRE